jgi:peptide/nickel transport system substrate-binding protein
MHHARDILPAAALRAICAASLLLLGACFGNSEAPAPQDPDTPRRGGTMVLGYIADIEGVNVLASTSSQPTTDVAQRLFLTLLKEHADIETNPPSFSPQLAESYEWSKDHLHLTFHLRKDVVWSDDTPLTAEDVRWTWQAQRSPEVAWDNATMKANITDVEVVDPHTVRFHFTHRYPGQMVHANEGVILPRHVWSKLPLDQWRNNSQWFLDHLVVSGPYTLERWVPQQEVVLVRNEKYFEEDLPYIDRLVFRIIPDSGAQLTQFFSGTLDYVRQVPSSMAEQVKANPKTKMVTYWPVQWNMVIWNLKNPMFEEATVRRALTMAIDRQTLVDTLWYGYAKVAASPLISNVWGHNPEIRPLPFDPEEAKRLLTEAGWVDADGDGIREKDGLRFSFELATNAGNQERTDATVMVQENLRQVGIEVKPRVLEWNTMSSRTTSGDFEAIIIALSIETSLDLTAYFHTNSIGKELNFGGYSNPEVDRLLEESRQQTELEETRPYLYKIQEILHQDQPQTVLWESQRLTGLSARVQGAKPNAVSSVYDLHKWWLSSP